MEAEGATSDQAELGVQALDASVGEVVAERGLDQGQVGADAAGELDEGLDATATSPAQPVLKQLHCLVHGQLEGQAELLFEQIGAVQGLVQLGDPGQARLLVLGEVLGVLDEGVASALDDLGQAPLVGAPGLVPDL